MITSVAIKNFTVFRDARIPFSSGLNVIIGENGTGKTQLLKLLYSASRVLFDVETAREKGLEIPTKTFAFMDRFLKTFKAEKLENLSRRGTKSGFAITLAGPGREISFSAKGKEFDVHDSGLKWDLAAPLFIPCKEVLSFFPGFAALYEKREIAMDQTFYDLCQAVALPMVKEHRLEKTSSLIKSLEEVIEGRFIIENGRVYLEPRGEAKMEIDLVAEGWRKFGMLALLLRNEAIGPGCSMFWDEPEANLNPRLMKKLAECVCALVRNGVQLFIATHSLFFLRELEILSSDQHEKPVSQRYIGLQKAKVGIVVEQGDSTDDLGPIASLDEELQQSDRFMNEVG